MTFDFERLEAKDPDEFETEHPFSWNRSYYAAVAEQFYPIFQLLFSTRWIKSFERDLKAANMNWTADVYLSGAFGVGTIFGGFTGLITLALVQFTTNSLGLLRFRFSWLPLPPEVAAFLSPLSLLMTILYVTSIGAVSGLILGFFIAYLYPKLKKSERSRSISQNMPAGVAFMYALAVGGMNHIDIFRAAAEADDTFQEFSVEFGRVMQRVDIFSDDFETAVEEVAATTPDDELSIFLTDMLSTLNSGGDITAYLDNAQEDYRRKRKQEEESFLDLLDLLGHMYMTMNIAPMMIVIVLVIMAVTGDPKMTLLMITVYVLIPVISAGYAAIISTFKNDETGDGFIELEDGTVPGRRGSSVLDLGPIDDYPTSKLFRQIRYRQIYHRLKWALQNPISLMVEKPIYTFAVTVPAAELITVALILQGAIEPSLETTIQRPIPQMIGFFFIPLYVTLTPYTVLFQYNERRRQSITDTLSTDLRKLARTNETKAPLHESLKIVADKSDSRLSDEFGEMYTKLQVQIPLTRSLIEFNNKYHIPRLARMTKILEKAQEVSSEITEVLQTAAATAEYQDQIVEERRRRMLLQVVVIEMAFLIFLGIMAAMEARMIDRIASEVGSSPDFAGFQAVNISLIKMLFFHAVVMQGLSSGMTAGYVQTGDWRHGLKYALVNATLALAVWLTLPFIS